MNYCTYPYGIFFAHDLTNFTFLCLYCNTNIYIFSYDCDVLIFNFKCRNNNFPGTLLYIVFIHSPILCTPNNMDTNIYRHNHSFTTTQSHNQNITYSYTQRHTHTLILTYTMHETWTYTHTPTITHSYKTYYINYYCSGFYIPLIVITRMRIFIHENG